MPGRGPRVVAGRPANMYDDPLLAELYDREETGAGDLALLRRMLAGRPGARVCEPFCGTGRLLLPLARDGHRLTGIELAPAMAARLRAKEARAPGPRPSASWRGTRASCRGARATTSWR